MKKISKTSWHNCQTQTLCTIEYSRLFIKPSFPLICHMVQSSGDRRPRLMLTNRFPAKVCPFFDDLGHYTAHAIPYFLSSNILSLSMLYFKSVAILISQTIQHHRIFYVYSTLPIKYRRPSIRDLPKQSFKKKINDCLLQIFSQTNDFPDLLTFFKHFQNRP